MCISDWSSDVCSSDLPAAYSYQSGHGVHNAGGVMGGIKIKYKIAVIYTVLTAAVLCIVSSFIYIVSSIHRKNEFYGRLQSRASIAAAFRFLQSEVDARLFEEISRKHSQALPEERERSEEHTSKLQSLMR